ncbi:MAG: orotate phosphoribosyltransferase [Flavobacteriales bacterium]|jgi:orotate phosphoribosyltransferase
MKDYKEQFIKLAIEAKVLKFGQFTLKSGRVSPYFFNAGLFQTGAQLAKLGQFYAQTLVDSKADIDMLFGPAYKGIPLVSSTAIALALHHDKDYPYAYNRKEAKAHGEGGTLVGAPLKGKVAIIDDVITAGTAIREVLDIIKDYDATASAILVGLDRQEKGNGELSAIQELEQECDIPVLSIVTLEQVIEYLRKQGSAQELQLIEHYRDKYGVA